MQNTLSTLYSSLPESLQPAAKRIYYGYQREPLPESVKAEFISSHFDSKAEYQSFVDEVRSSDIEEIIREAENKYKAMVPE